MKYRFECMWEDGTCFIEVQSLIGVLTKIKESASEENRAFISAFVEGLKKVKPTT